MQDDSDSYRNGNKASFQQMGESWFIIKAVFQKQIVVSMIHICYTIPIKYPVSINANMQTIKGPYSLIGFIL